jgi:hypothetical protein
MITYNRRAALEMSVGTIVTIVLMVSMLVLGLVLIRTIFGGSTTAIDQINSKVSNQIDRLFQESDNAALSVFPTDQRVYIPQGSQDKGFAFKIRNLNSVTTDFTYSIALDSVYADELGKQCPGASVTGVNSWITSGQQGSVTIGPGKIQEGLGKLVLFKIPRDAPTCTLPFNLEIEEKPQKFYSSTTVYLIVQGA